MLAANGDRALNGGVNATYVYGTGVPLYNAKGRVILKSGTGAIVDRVEWSAAAGFPIPVGRSISLGLPTSDNALGANWCESTVAFGAGDLGTPGEDNSCEGPPGPPAVVISEVMRNPAVVSDSNGEWFEVHNTTSAPVDMAGWTLTDGASDHHVIKGSLVVPADGYLVLGRDTDIERNGGAPVAYSYGNAFVLSNGNDAIIVSDQYGQRVDEMHWTSTDDPRPNGASIALLDGRWCESGPQFGEGDRGTPGAANDCTQRPHPDVVINEVHIDPAALSDTVAEWFELYNAGTEVVDLNGWVLRDDDYDSFKINADHPLLVAPGATFVLGRDTAALNGGAPVDYVYGSRFPLVENADEINLYDAALVPVDRVAWTPDRQLPYAVGASAALRSAGLDNSVPANWCTSVTTYGSLGERGTPGAANVCEIVDPTEATTTTTTSAATTSTTTTSTEPATTTPTTTSTLPTTTASTTTTTTTTTTVATPTLSGPTILSLFGGSQGDGLQMSGSKIKITGDVRSNGDVMISGSSIAVSGTISYGGTGNIGHGVTSAGVVRSTTPVAAGLPWTIGDFAPGGRYSTSAGYVSHHDSIVISTGGLTPGIHYVAGDVTISQSAPALTGVTIVATGRITISGSSTMSPAASGLPTLLSGAGSYWTNAIQISGSNVTWTGVIAAPGGGIQISSSSISGGRLVAGNVQLSGSNITLG